MEISIISINKKSNLTYSQFKKAVGKHFLKYPEKNREEMIEENYLELFPNAKINKYEPKDKDTKSKKNKRIKDSIKKSKEK